MADALDPSKHRPTVIRRVDNVVSIAANDRLLAAWDRLIATPGMRYPHNEKNRSSTAALHLGTWELYASLPRLTGDFLEQDDNVKEAIHTFLGVVKE